MPTLSQKAEPDRDESIPLRLRYATFDPLQGEPPVPAELHVADDPLGEQGAYIVQFWGPIQEEVPLQLEALGAQVTDYVPDYAYLVRMDEEVRGKIQDLEAVRWVGLYQPAYKISPSLDRARGLYRVVLFDGADLKAVESRLDGLDTPTVRVPGEKFMLILPQGGVELVAAWPEVLWIENQPLYELTNDVGTGILGGANAWGHGYTGSGMTLTVTDTGIDTGVDTPAVGDIHPDFDNRMTHISSWAVQDDGCEGCCFVNTGDDDGPADTQSGHGTHVLGSVGGNGAASEGQFKGLAYEASLTFQAVQQWVLYGPDCKPEDQTVGYELAGLPFDDLTPIFSEAYTTFGSRIHSNSWHSPAYGAYTSDAQIVDRFVWDHPDAVLLFSAGNDGIDAVPIPNGYPDEGSIGSPATAKNCISVGASENQRTTGGYNPGGPCWTYGNCWPSDFPVDPTNSDRLSDDRDELVAFSSRGPTDDGRLKPDVVGPGSNILSSRSTLAWGTGWGLYPGDPDYMYNGGTSMATPLVAGAATLVREYYLETKGHAPSAALVKATLINAAQDIAGLGTPGQEAALPIPNNHEGWGRVNVGAATTGDRDFHDGDRLTTGFSASYNHDIHDSSKPFKVTLAWSDYPAALPAGGLVNNLDLVVVAPGGTTYRGNNLSNGWSQPGGFADGTNNVESVYIQNPTSGTWTVRVEGTNVPQGPQPLAVVVTGGFTPPINYDHHLYLPLINKSVAGSAVRNGDFEEGKVAWVEYSHLGYDLIVDSSYLQRYANGLLPRSGDWAAWLGGSSEETAYIEQQMTILPGKTFLSYWHWIDSNDSCLAPAEAKVLVNDVEKDTYDLCQGTQTGAWQPHSVDLSAYAGTPVSLRIRVETNPDLVSSLFVDDVSFQASALAAPAMVQNSSAGGDAPPDSPWIRP
jgi:subtilisin family serine protease